MLRSTLFVLAVAVLVLTLVLGGCPKKQEAVQSPPVVPTGPAAQGEPAADTAASQPPAGEAAGATAPAGAVTKEQVKGFMASMEDKQVEAVMDKLSKDAGVDKKSKDVDAAAMAKVFEAAAKSAELDKAVVAHGFKDAAEWVTAAKVVFPGMGHAMAKAMAPTLGVKEGTPEFEKMMKESEFAEMEKAFAKLTPEQQKLVDEAVAEMMKEQMSKHEKK